MVSFTFRTGLRTDLLLMRVKMNKISVFFKKHDVKWNGDEPAILNKKIDVIVPDYNYSLTLSNCTILTPIELFRTCFWFEIFI